MKEHDGSYVYCLFGIPIVTTLVAASIISHTDLQDKNVDHTKYICEYAHSLYSMKKDNNSKKKAINHLLENMIIDYKKEGFNASLELDKSNNNIVYVKDVDGFIVETLYLDFESMKIDNISNTKSNNKTLKRTFN